MTIRITQITYLGSGAVRVTLSDGEDSSAYILDPAELDALAVEEESELTPETLDALLISAARFEAVGKAASILARADSSKKELVRKLRRRGIGAEHAEDAADFLEDRGYIDDLAYAERIVEHYSRFKRYGRARVADELRKRGIGGDDVKTALEGAEPDGENILLLFDEKYTGRDLSDLRERRRVSDALARYGYRYGDIREMIEGLVLNESGDFFEEN